MLLSSCRGSRRTACACLLALALLSGAAWLLPHLLSGGAASAADATFVRRIPLTVNDLVYDGVSQRLYASVPSVAGAGGNSITPVDPATGAVGTPVFVGSEPGRLALSDDGKYLYTFLEGAMALRRFDLTTQTPGLQFVLRSSPASAPYIPSDFAVVPGKPESIAVSGNSAVAVYDGDVRRGTTANNIFSNPYLEFGAAADTLYGVAPGGGGSALYKFSVAAGGVTLASTTSASNGGDFRLAGGRVYLPTGQVYDAASGALQGTFPDVGFNSLVLPDPASGRVYFLLPTGGINPTVTLRAYDINTFVLLGSASIPVSYSSPASLVRWGANGLAFRVRNYNGLPDGFLYVVQTTLIPSAEPVPTPTPTPTPSASPTPAPTPVTFVRQLALPANDLAYDPTRQQLYASVPSVAGAAGNTMTAVDPATGAVGASTFVGSEPNRMALTDDGQYLYVGLDGAGAVRRFDLTSGTPGPQFWLGNSTYDGPYLARDIATLPGQPELVAVARGAASYFYSMSVAVYDGGVQRPTVAGGGDALESSSKPSTLYGSGSFQDFQRLTVNASGVNASGSLYGGGTTGDFRVAGETLYTRHGKVIDGETGTLKGTFPGIGSYTWSPLVAPDPDHGRVFFLTSNGTSTATLSAYDINTFRPLGSVNIPNVVGAPAALVRWGADGLAFRTSGGGGGSYDTTVTAAGQVFLIQSALVSGSSPAAPPPVPTPTQTPTTPAPVVDVNQLTLATNDLVYEPTRKTLYASVPGSAGAGGNSVTPVDPAAETVGTPVFVGSEPKRLALSDDARYLYVGLDGAGAVRRFDLTNNTAGLQFSLGSTQFSGPYKALDLAVLPGQPDSVAVTRTAGGGNGVVVYDNDAQRPNVATASSPGYIEFPGAAGTLYSSSTNNSLIKMSLDAQGATYVSGTPVGTNGDFRAAGGRLYMPSGQVIEAATGNFVGKFSGVTYNSLVAPDPANGRVYFLVGADYYGFSPVTLTIKAFDINTFLPLGSVQVPNVATQPTSLVRWGSNGLAFRTGPNTNGGTGSPPGNQIFLVRTSLVPSDEVIPPRVKFALSSYTVNEYATSASVNVIRSGDIAAPATVNYSTSDGTAKAGQDYTAASGTLSFAAGETSKSFTVPVVNDNVYEGGAEVINLTLDGPTGAALGTPSTAALNIFDDDIKPYVSVRGQSITEPDTGTAGANFVVTLSNPSVENVSVNYATANGTATAGSDYAAASGTLTIPAGATSGTVTVQVNGDHAVEPDESFYLNISNLVNGAYIISSQGVCTITNNDAPGAFVFNAASYVVSEGAGSLVVTVNRVGGSSGGVTVNYSTSDVTAKAGQDYTAASGTLSFAGGETTKTFTVPVTDDGAQEPDETVALLLSGATGGALYGTPSAATVIVRDDDQPLFHFAASNYSVAEGAGQVVLTVRRSGDTSGAASVGYSTADGTATEMSDYGLTLGRLRFAPGESEKAIPVLVNDDAIGEPSETFVVHIGGGTGAGVTTPSTATVTIEGAEEASSANPLDDSRFFVRQHYHDFLNREPDEDGLNYWTNDIEACGADAACRESKRVNVSAAFFLSIEFQQTGYLVYRLNQLAFNSGERQEWRQFLADTQEIGRGVQVGAAGWADKLEENKQAFVSQFAARGDFALVYQGMSSGQFVDALNANTLDPLAPGLGGALTKEERDRLVSDLDQSRKTRAQVLRAVAENAEFARRQSNRAFVLMQYYGYLRRNPNSPPDSNFDGYNFWLGKLNQFNGDAVAAEMVKAFLESIEYRRRFGR